MESRDIDDTNEAEEEGMEEEEEEEEEADSDDSDSEIGKSLLSWAKFLDEEALEQKTALKEAIAELESNLEKKRADLAVATNPIIKVSLVTA